MRQQARIPTTRCCTQREIGLVDVKDEASRCAMEAADKIKAKGIEIMTTTISDPPEKGGVEAMRTGKGKPSRSVGIVASKATWKASAGRRVSRHTNKGNRQRSHYAEGSGEAGVENRTQLPLVLGFTLAHGYTKLVM